MRDSRIHTTFVTKKHMRTLVETIKAGMADFIKDADLQLEKGNKAAGARARKAALELSKQLKEFRKESVEFSKQ